MSKTLIFVLLVVAALRAQNVALPLESVQLEGTALSQAAVLDLAELRIGAPIDKVRIEAACAKLQGSGVFESINYRYAPGPKRGYVLTLTLSEQKALTASSIDIPGADEIELWKWLVSRYPPFNRRVPGNDSAQKLIAKQLEEHLGATLQGRRIVARMEADLRNSPLVSFQPEILSQVASIGFTGNSEFSSEALAGMLKSVFADRGYTDRAFSQVVDLNLRRAYEEHGMYRVRFPKVIGRNVSRSEIEVAVSIEEGARFMLGDVQYTGGDLPLDVITKAAKFKTGQLANWTEIQKAIWDLERPVMRAGYMKAKTGSERGFKDGPPAILDLRVKFNLGPLYHFGQLKVAGLDAGLEARARKLWKMKTGDPYDLLYANDFFREFFKSVNKRFKKVSAPEGKDAGDHVIDVTLLFEPLP